MRYFVGLISQEPKKLQQLWTPKQLDNRLDYALGYNKTFLRLPVT